MSIGYFLRRTGMATRVGPSASCASACVFAFLGGVVREAHSSSRLGVHMSSMMFVDEYIRHLKKILLTPTDELSVDDKIRLIVAFNEQSTTQVANAETSYVIKM